MLLREGSGIFKHVSTKQLWAQGAIKQKHSIGVQKVGREAIQGADTLTQCVLRDHLQSGPPADALLSGDRQPSARLQFRRANLARNDRREGGA